MKICTIILTFLLSTTLFAKSEVAEETKNWQGFYLTGNLGGGWNEEDAKYTNANFFNTLGAALLGNDLHFSSAGLVGGGGIGGNLQVSWWVLGLEAGASVLNFSDRKASPSFPDFEHDRSTLNWIGYTKAQTGFAIDSFFAYVTGGWAGASTDLDLNDIQFNVSSHLNAWANGWTVGAGVGYLVTKIFSVGVQYDYYRMWYHDKLASCPSCGSGIA